MGNKKTHFCVFLPFSVLLEPVYSMESPLHDTEDIEVIEGILCSHVLLDGLAEDELFEQEEEEGEGNVIEADEDEGLDEDDGIQPIDLSPYPTLSPTTQFTAHTDSIYCCAVDATCSYCLTGGGDDTAYVWNVLNGEIYLKMEGFTDSVVSVGFSFDNTLAAAASMDKTVFLFIILILIS